jgi:uncharacterized protein
MPDSASAPAPHPCLRCGACCASFRVAFYWAETQPPLQGGIPAALTSKLDPLRVAMLGTDQAQPRCIALIGEVGRDARCGEYERRPSPCRSLAPAWERGAPSEQCDRARARHGLRPLSEIDWAIYGSGLGSHAGEEVADTERA